MKRKVKANTPLLALKLTKKHFSLQMAYVAAFTVSAYSTTAIRTGKPFNPLLGETYECDRTDDMGWKCITEQVLYTVNVRVPNKFGFQTGPFGSVSSHSELG